MCWTVDVFVVDVLGHKVDVLVVDVLVVDVLGQKVDVLEVDPVFFFLNNLLSLFLFGFLLFPFSVSFSVYFSVSFSVSVSI